MMCAGEWECCLKMYFIAGYKTWQWCFHREYCTVLLLSWFVDLKLSLRSPRKWKIVEICIALYILHTMLYSRTSASRIWRKHRSYSCSNLYICTVIVVVRYLSDLSSSVGWRSAHTWCSDSTSVCLCTSRSNREFMLIRLSKYNFMYLSTRLRVYRL